MPHRGLNHIGLSTLDLNKTRAFYEDVLGFKAVVADTIRIAEGGHISHLFFDIGGGQFISFMESRGVAGVPTDFDASINGGLGLPTSFYHFALEAGSEAALVDRRDELSAKGVQVSNISDHDWSRSFYFKDPNGVSLEYCCQVRALTADDATMQERFTAPRAALNLGGADAEGFNERDSREKQPA